MCRNLIIYGLKLFGDTLLETCDTQICHETRFEKLWTKALVLDLFHSVGPLVSDIHCHYKSLNKLLANTDQILYFYI